MKSKEILLKLFKEIIESRFVLYNELDAQVGDGDTGSTLKSGFEALLSQPSI